MRIPSGYAGYGSAFAGEALSGRGKNDLPSALSSGDGSSLAKEEARILRDVENHLQKADPESLQVRYDYALGPDGKRYITGAHISYLEEEELPSSEALQSDQEAASAHGSKASGDASPSPTYGEDPQVQAAVRELEKIDREVRAHEAAHMAVGGQYAGGASYTYTVGPDGKRYAVGGEVPISAPGGSTPEETLRIMQQVRAAALSPGSPSGQDRQVAAAAASAEAQARMELQAQSLEGQDSKELWGFSGETKAFAAPQESAKEEILSSESLFGSFFEHKFLGNHVGEEESPETPLLSWQNFRRAYEGPWVTERSKGFESAEEFSWNMAM
jgi:hypothetical protein